MYPEPRVICLKWRYDLLFAGVRHATYRDARGVTHSYFFSWEHAPTKSLEVDWLDSRNICRRHCMDAVSLETPQENEFVKQRLVRGKHDFQCLGNRETNQKDNHQLQVPNRICT